MRRWSLALCLCACSSSGADLFVEVRTDYRGGLEFETVRVSLSSAGSVVRSVSSAASRAQDYTVGVRVAELDSVEPGSYVLGVELVSLDAVVASASIDVEVTGSRGMVVTITRDCAATTCSAAGTSCLNTRCLPDMCLLGERVGCEPSCATDAECAAPVACARGRCAGGVCLAIADDSACGGSICHLERGCESSGDGGIADSGLDGSAADAGLDGGAPPDPSLIFWLPFDDAPGTGRFADATGNGHDAECTDPSACPTSAPGRIGRAALFDGLDDGLVIPHDPALDAREFTVMLWARASSPGTTERYRTLIAQPFGLGVGNSWELYFSMETLVARAYEVGGGASGASPGVGVWFHAALRWDGTTLVLFIDGVDRGVWAVPVVEYEVRDVRIGHDENSGVINSFFGGELDDVRFYRRALSDVEIALIVREAP